MSQDNEVVAENEKNVDCAFGLVGRKIGMSRIFQDDGTSIPVTIIEVAKNVVSDILTVKRNGYDGIQVAFGKKKKSKVSKSIAGACGKSKIDIPESFVEFRSINGDSPPVVGSVLSPAGFDKGDYINVSGVSKGKGYAGAIKRHGFSSQRTSHGNSVSHRAIGSTGMCQDPGRVFKGKKMSGHLGSVNRTTRNLEVVKVDADEAIIAVKGSVPGNNGSRVILKPSIKAQKKNLR